MEARSERRFRDPFDYHRDAGIIGELASHRAASRNDYLSNDKDISPVKIECALTDSPTKLGFCRALIK